MANTNKHGLSRHIPEKVKYEVRKNSGWGCVICGSGIIHYDHVEPEFVDCIDHNPNDITLLCPTCHDKKKRKFLTVATIRRAMQNPKPLQQGFSSELLDVGTQLPNVLFAGNYISSCRFPLLVDGVPFMEIKPPEEPGAPYRISAVFFNLEGQISLQIVDNEWIAFNSNWDIEAKAGKLKVLFAEKMYSLILNVTNENILEIEYIHCIMGNKLINGNRAILSVKNLENGSIHNYGGNFYKTHTIGFEF